MNTIGISEKYDHLLEILQRLKNVAVAFSGGIDSTFLLHAACEALEKGNVVALHGVSCLLSAHSIQTASHIFERHFSGKAQLRRIELLPLFWNEFVKNDRDRCYFCKKRTYSIFMMEMEKEGKDYLIDGTNADDLKERRPGLRAIKEFGVQTPLDTAGLNKSEIRKLAEIFGLENHGQPSNSCLATRIATEIPITVEILRRIDAAECFLQNKGFDGCRVRSGLERTSIEVRSDDVERITLRENRESLLHYFHSIGLFRVVLDLHGRE
jgi:pyridinium-3,5-biscarboxylic acid mononucleotide sulfurtransferase